MNLMLELPGGKYFAVPRDVIEKYAVSKDAFEKELAEKERTGRTVFAEADVPEVEGQQQRPPPPPIRKPSAVLGVRG